MTIYGPWEQPADTTVDIGSSSLFRRFVADGFTGETLHDALYGLCSEDPPSHSNLGVDYENPGFGSNNGSAGETFAVWPFSTWGTSIFTPVPPTPAELAQPHVIGYEYESPYGVALGTTATLTGTLGTAGGDTPSSASIGTNVEVRHAGPTGWSSTGPTFTWWTPPQLAAMPILLSMPVTDAVGTTYTTTVPYDGVTDYPAVLCFNRQANEDPPPVTHWIFEGILYALFMTIPYRPPRYRLLYDLLPPLRQFPRDDALGGQPRQSGSRSVQATARTGWAGTYR